MRHSQSSNTLLLIARTLEGRPQLRRYLLQKYLISINATRASLEIGTCVATLITANTPDAYFQVLSTTRWTKLRFTRLIATMSHMRIPSN